MEINTILDIFKEPNYKDYQVLFEKYEKKAEKYLKNKNRFGNGSISIDNDTISMVFMEVWTSISQSICDGQNFISVQDFENNFDKKLSELHGKSKKSHISNLKELREYDIGKENKNVNDEMQIQTIFSEQNIKISKHHIIEKEMKLLQGKKHLALANYFRLQESDAEIIIKNLRDNVTKDSNATNIQIKARISDKTKIFNLKINDYLFKRTALFQSL
jgi:hypothetical protein